MVEKNNLSSKVIKTSLSLALGILCLIGVNACSSGLPSSNNNNSPTLTPTNNLSLGFNPGIALTENGAQITEKSVVGARIPIDGGNSLEVIFTAFATAAQADDVDGQGPLVKGTNPPSDGNDTSDVFVAAVVNGGITFEQAFVETIRHERCVNCHGFNDPVNPTVPEHTGGRDSDCSLCHTDASSGITNVAWEAPPVELDFRGKTVEELCEQIKDFDGDVREHMIHDTKIDWAISSGLVPDNGPGPTQLGTAPISKTEWDRRVDEWINGGMICDNQSAVKDIKAVSLIPNGTSTGNGSSFSPTITYLPALQINLKGINTSDRVGTLIVAYSSNATNLTSVATSPSTDIYRQVFDVFVNQNPDGDPEQGGIRIVRSSSSQHISQRGGISGNAASQNPSMNETGEIIAYESQATNLVANFQDNNGADLSDVYITSIPSGTTSLLSRAEGNATSGGDGASSNPRMGSNGPVVTWQSTATDLVLDDDNNVQDIFWAAFDNAAVPNTVKRASLRTNGQEGTAGDCRNADIHALNPQGSEALIVFESDKTDLIAPQAVSAIPNIFLRDSRTGGSTTLISQAKTTSESGTPGNGGSRFPDLSPRGNAIVYQTDASNLDTDRPTDNNNFTDVILVDLNTFFDEDQVRGKRLSISGGGADGNGPSERPILAGFQAPLELCDSSVFAAYLTQATNVGASENSGSVLLFLDEDELSQGGPTCEIVADKEVANPGTAFNFDGRNSQSEVAIATYIWEFGDGNTGSGDQVSHTYSDPGTYEVVLRVTDVNGACSSCTTTVRVNAAPTCSVTVNPETHQDLGNPVTFTFDASESTDSDGEIVNYNWHFNNDGNPINTDTPILEMTFNGADDHFVTVVVTDNDGATSDEFCFTVFFVNAQPICAFEVTTDGEGIFTNQTATFDASSSSDQEQANSQLTFEWDFGDGTSATGEVVTHAYDRQGMNDFTVTATLTVTDPDGGQSTCSAPIDVRFRPNQGPQIVLKVNDTVIPAQNAPDILGAYVNQTITLDASDTIDPDTGDDSGITYDWDIVDAGGNTLNPTFLDAPKNSIATVQTSVHGGTQVTLIATDTPPQGEQAADATRNIEVPVGARFLSVNEIFQGCGGGSRSCHLFNSPGFSSNANSSWASTVDVNASCGTGDGVSTAKFVDNRGGDTALNNSTLWKLVNPVTNPTQNCLSRTSMDITDPNRLSIIESWIRSGAANN